MRVGAMSGIAVVLAAAAFGLAARDTVDGPHGAEKVRDNIQGQGCNETPDRAYAFWAQHDACQRGAANTNWISVANAIAYAKKTWNVTIIDQTGDANVGAVKFCCAVGDLDKEYALPIFMEALTMAVEGARQDCYVERQLHCRDWENKNPWRSKIYIRKARPLQPDPADVKPAAAPVPAKKEAPAKKEEPKKSSEAAPAAPAVEQALQTGEKTKEQASAE